MEALVGSFASLFGSLLDSFHKKGKHQEATLMREVTASVESLDRYDWETTPRDIACSAERSVSDEY